MNKKSYGQLLRIEKPFRVKTYEVDFMQIVSNIVYIKWFEDLRIAFLDKWLPLENIFNNGISPVLSHTEIDYKHPVKLNNRPIGAVWVSSMGRAKWELEFEFKENDCLFCTGKQTGYFIDLETFRPVPMPEQLIKAYSRATESG